MAILYRSCHSWKNRLSAFLVILVPSLRVAYGFCQLYYSHLDSDRLKSDQRHIFLSLYIFFCKFCYIYSVSYYTLTKSVRASLQYSFTISRKKNILKKETQ